jgi:hypothetical protein
MGHGSWVMGHGSWVMGHGSWETLGHWGGENLRERGATRKGTGGIDDEHAPRRNELRGEMGGIHQPGTICPEIIKVPKAVYETKVTYLQSAKSIPSRSAVQCTVLPLDRPATSRQESQNII